MHSIAAQAINARAAAWFNHQLLGLTTQCPSYYKLLRRAGVQGAACATELNPLRGLTAHD